MDGGVALQKDCDGFLMHNTHQLGISWDNNKPCQLLLTG